MRGWTQEALAEASGLHPTYISLLERSRVNPRLENIEKLAKVLEISLSELYSEPEAGSFEARYYERRKGIG